MNIISFQPIGGTRFPCISPGGVPAFFTVWSDQTERETPLCNLKLHAARFRVCMVLAALAGVLSSVGGKPFFEVGAVGTDMDKGSFSSNQIAVVFSCLVSPVFINSPCYAIGAFFGCFFRLLPWEKRLFSNRKRSGDTFLVQSVFIVKYAIFTVLDRQTYINSTLTISSACALQAFINPTHFIGSAALSASVAPVLLVSYPSAPSQPIILGGFVIGVLLALSQSAAWLDANMRVF